MIRICVPFAFSLPNLLSFACSNDIDWQAQDRNSEIWNQNILPVVGDYQFVLVGLVCRRLRRLYARDHPK